MQPEIYFLKYAYPCAHKLLQRGLISLEEFKLIRKSSLEEKLLLSKKRVTTIFWRATQHLPTISDMKTLEYFWRFKHNEIMIKKFSVFEDTFDVVKQCLVIPCRILAIQKECAIVKSRFFHETVNLKTELVRNVDKGDFVAKHYGHICEKLDRNTYEEIERHLRKVI